MSIFTCAGFLKNGLKRDMLAISSFFGNEHCYAKFTSVGQMVVKISHLVIFKMVVICRLRFIKM